MKKINNSEMKKFVNSLKKTNIDLDVSTAKLRNVAEQRVVIKTENLALARDNKNLKTLNKKLEKIKAGLIYDVNDLNKRIEDIDKAGELRVSKRLDEVEKIVADNKKFLNDIEKERTELKEYLKDYVQKKKDIDKRESSLFRSKARLRVKADDIQKEKEDIAKKQKSWRNKIADLKNEEVRIETLRLRVLKLISDNSNIKELEKLRKEFGS